MLHTPALSCEIRTDIKFNVISRIYCYENCSIHKNVFIKKRIVERYNGSRIKPKKIYGFTEDSD